MTRTRAAEDRKKSDTHPVEIGAYTSDAQMCKAESSLLKIGKPDSILMAKSGKHVVKLTEEEKRGK